MSRWFFREIRIVPIFLCFVCLECLTFVCWCQWSTFIQQVLFLSVYNGFTFIDLWWSFQGHCCLEWWILIPLVYVESLPQTFIMSAISNTNIKHYYMTINISFIWLAKSLRFFLDRTLWILSEPSISAKINLDRSRRAFGMLY